MKTPSKIVVIQGHPDEQSFNESLAKAYVQGAQASGAEVRVVNVREMQFDLIMHHGYRRRQELEKDVVDAQETIAWADHLVFIYPVWWGNVPALLKGFIDRVFLPGFAFRMHPQSVWQEKLLKGRSARIISTMDQPNWFYRWVNGKPSHRAMKKTTLEFCGITPVKITSLGPLRFSTPEKRERWLQVVHTLGSNRA